LLLYIFVAILSSVALFNNTFAFCIAAIFAAAACCGVAIEVAHVAVVNIFQRVFRRCGRGSRSNRGCHTRIAGGGGPHANTSANANTNANANANTLRTGFQVLQTPPLCNAFAIIGNKCEASRINVFKGPIRPCDLKTYTSNT